MNQLDILCIGRAAVDLYAEQYGSSLEDVSSFSKYVGGCPANIAIGTSRLGLKSGILSRIGDEAMGRFVRKTLRNEGVDVSFLQTDPDRLTGLVLLGVDPPDRFPLIFYRQNCSDMHINIREIDLNRFRNVKAVLLTGTHCSTVEMLGVTLQVMKVAKEAGAKIILDIDYRPVLWGAVGHNHGDARDTPHGGFAECIKSLIESADLIVGTEEELRVAVNKEQGEITALQEITDAIIVQKRGCYGCVAWAGKNEVVGDPFSVDVLNILGAGDAFMSGFLSGWLRKAPLEECCTLGNAAGALVVSRHGCSPEMPFWEELQFFIKDQNNMPLVNQLHKRMQRKPVEDTIFLLAFDHRTYFKKYQVSQEDIEGFKELVFEAALDSDVSGIIIDDQYGSEIIGHASKNDLLIARCIEAPNAHPLCFTDQREASEILSSWPVNHLIKVLCYATKEIDIVRTIQLKRLKDLATAAEIHGHEMVIEITHAKNSDHLSLITEMIDQCYSKGIAPSWWKLPPIIDSTGWKEIEALIKKHDPYCKGVLLLGNHCPIDDLRKIFDTVQNMTSLVCGYAVGRTLWADAAEGWFSEAITSQEVIDSISQNIKQLTHSWEKQEVLL